MPRTSQDISQQIRAQLKVLDPSISADPLTPERKIIDTVSEVIAEASFDDWLINYQFDIDTKVGSDLDKFVALFGFARQRARRATGLVTLSRGTPAERDVLIPAGTQVIRPASGVNVAAIFITTVSVILAAGTTSVEVPIEAVNEGLLGNVPANTITTFGAGLPLDISDVTNENATTGGTAGESDAELRVRFKNTIFRNIAGTQDQYLALAIASRYANKANVIGPVSRFIEYVQVPSNNTVLSQIPYSKYTYNFDYFLTNGDASAEVFYTPGGVDYTFNATSPPTFNVNNNSNIPINSVVLLEHAYCSANSRNDPTNEVHNYVDVYVSGSNIESVLESTRFPASGQNFNTTGGSPYNITNFRRAGSAIQPVVGNRYMSLLWQPVAILPSSMVIGEATYFLGTDYWLVEDVTVFKGSKRARNGIEWSAAAASTILTGTDFVIDYNFDKLPIQLNELMDAHKQVTSDVLVHTATERYFVVNLIVMYTPGYSQQAVDAAVTTSLTNFMERLNFGSFIQMSDVIDVVHDVPGVDNVRLAAPGDNVAYGVQEVSSDGVTLLGSPRTTDFAIQDSDLPVLQAIVTTRRSQNTWN